jgi:hypothetical protein
MIYLSSKLENMSFEEKPSASCPTVLGIGIHTVASGDMVQIQTLTTSSVTTSPWKNTEMPDEYHDARLMMQDS